VKLTSTAVADYIISDKTPNPKERYHQLREESKELIIPSLKILALLIALAGIFAMIFEARYFSEFSVQVFLTRLSATLIAFAVLIVLNSKHSYKFAIGLVHVLMLTIIISSGYMIYLIPSTLIMNSHLLGLIIFTCSLFLSWEVKQQVITVVYYNIVFGAAILLNRSEASYHPDLIETVLFIVFLSVISIIVSAMNFRLRMQLWDKSYRVQLSEKKFKSIFDNSAEGIFQSTPDGHFLTINEALVKILGYNSKEELLKADISNDIYFYPSDRQKLVSRLKTEEEVKNYILKLKKKNGSVVFVRLNDRIVHDEDKSRVYYEGNMQDITEQVLADEKRKKAEELLRIEKEKSDKLAKEAQESNIIKSQFLANMSHEIRTPMNGILGYLSLIEKEAYEDSEYMKQFAASAKNSADALMDIINNILDLSKIESGKMELNNAPFNLFEVIDDAVSIVSSKASEKKLRIHINVSENTPAGLIGDGVRLRQIFMNLLSNAIKFTEEGSVTISSSVLSSDEGNVLINFSVSDTGVGILPEKISQLFLPFSQIDSSPTRKFGGSGLGLAICREFVSMMGSLINVQSEVGKGSSFSFEVKFKIYDHSVETRKLNRVIDFHPSPKKSAVKKTIKNKSGSTVKVLLAEDNIINQKLAVKMLADAGFDVDTANSGTEALKKLQDKKFDIVLMDIQMPDMDGFMVTTEIRKSDLPFSNIPIIAITAHAIPGYKEKCLEAGMNDFISKPVSADALVSKINSLLGSGTTQVNDKIPLETTEENPLFDFQLLRKMSLGETAFQSDLLNTFFDDTAARIKKLESYIGEQDFNMISKEAHTIKGAGNSVGAKQMAEIAFAVEVSAGVNDIENVRKHYDKLAGALNETKNLLKNSGFI